MNELPPPEPPPHGHIASPEAARLLGVSTQTIRNRIRAGTLDGQDLLTSEGVRYYALREAVEKEARDKHLPAVKGDTRDVMLNSNYLAHQIDQHLTRVENLLETFSEEERQRYGEMLIELRSQFDQIRRNQDRQIDTIAEAVQLLREAAETEKHYQERVMQMMEKRREPVDYRPWIVGVALLIVVFVVTLDWMLG